MMIQTKQRITGRRQRKLAGAMIILLSLAGAARAETFYDRHVFFDNSATDGSYYQSEGMVTPPSKLEMVDYKLPVDTNHFTSPPNGLRLRWTSAPGGHWQMKIKSLMRYERHLAFDGDTLSFWCFSDTELTPENAPRIALQDRNDFGSATIPLLAAPERLPAGKWIHVSIPFTKFKSLFEPPDDITVN